MSIRAAMIALGFSLIASAAVAQGTPMVQACQPGAKVQVLWKDKWYPATVRAPMRGDGACPIGYDGFGREWDEAVMADRMRTVGR